MLAPDDFRFLYGCIGLYLGLTLVITRRVARAMSAISQPLLARCFGLDGETANGLIRGLVVGFYLVNLGLVFYRIDAVNMRVDSPLLDIVARLGVSLLVLALTYYLSLAVAIRMARAAQGWLKSSETGTGQEK